MPPNEWKNKGVGYLRPGYKQSSEVRTVTNEDTGKVAGKVREHFDGRQDAKPEPGTVRLHISQERD